MHFASLRQAVDALQAKGELRIIDAEMDPDLEMAVLHRRVQARGGPALLFTRVRGTEFPCVSNLYGTRARTAFLLGPALARVRKLMRLKTDPTGLLRRPWELPALLRLGWDAFVRPRKAPEGWKETSLSRLPQIRCWPRDGGAFVTLPQVYTEHPRQPGWMRSNLGMYRIQLGGGEYIPDKEAGLHYQIHRGIGVHHHAALQAGKPLPVSVFVGGPPAHALAAVMPLPESVPELAFAGMLAGRPFGYARRSEGFVSSDADFCLLGRVLPGETKPEGPFGDHLGYYSLAHDFPVLRIDTVLHRPGAIWPFTVVGRPPQEDAHFSEVIHDLAGDVLASVLPGVRSVHAVEAAGVHPLLLATASDRYWPTGEKRPRELHTLAHAILGYGQLSLAKFLFLADADDGGVPDIRDVPAFLAHVLARCDFARDLHFISKTTLDTLDYTGTGLNEGSKVFVAVSGPPRRRLAAQAGEPGAELGRLAEALEGQFRNPRLCAPGILAVEAEPFSDAEEGRAALRRHIAALEGKILGGNLVLRETGEACPLWVVVDDSAFAAAHPDNLWWVAFTRSDPAPDLTGLFAAQEHKHWGCGGPLILDARVKPWHAPALEPDPVLEVVEKKLEGMAAAGGPLEGLF